MNLSIWLFIFISGLIGVVIVVSLTLPCYYIVEGEYRGKFTGVVRVKSGPFIFYWSPEEEKRQQIGNENKGRLFKNRQELRLLLKPGIIVSLIELGGRLWSRLHPQAVYLEGKLGFTNPYYTGLLAAGLAAFPRSGVCLEPDFSGAVCQGRIYLEGSACLSVLFYVIGKAFLTQPLRPVVWTFLSRKKREERQVGSMER